MRGRRLAAARAGSPACGATCRACAALPALRGGRSGGGAFGRDAPLGACGAAAVPGVACGGGSAAACWGLGMRRVGGPRWGVLGAGVGEAWSRLGLIGDYFSGQVAA